MTQIDARERDLRVPTLDDPCDLIDDARGLDTATGAPRARHDAEGAAVLTAVLHFHERARAPGYSRRQIDVGNARRREIADFDARRSARGLQQVIEQRRQARLVSVADDEVHAGLARDLGRARLRPAAGDDHTRVGIAAARAANRLAIGDLRARGHRAGVDDHDVGGRTERYRREAARLERRLQLLAVHLVEAAAQRGERDARHATASLSCPHAAPMSSPLLQRTVVMMPASSRIDWNARIRARGGRRNPEPGQSLNGIRLTFARTPRSRRARRRASSGLSFIPSSSTYSKNTRCRGASG